MFSVKQNSLLPSQIDFGKMTRLQAFRVKYPGILRPKEPKIQLSKTKWRIVLLLLLQLGKSRTSRDNKRVGVGGQIA